MTDQGPDSDVPPAVALYGTPIVEPVPRPLRAGKLSAWLDRGALRWIRWGDVEVVRGLFFIVRTPSWATLAATIDDLAVTEEDDAFRVTYRAGVFDGSAGVDVRIDIAGSAAGRLEAAAAFRARGNFSTNRTGFIVLHPIDGFAGARIDVEHSDGRLEATELPLLIRPDQPVRDIRALGNRPAPGLRADLRFGGEVFEMEDQRNWTDASFKTYSRPIDWQRPYILPDGRSEAQSVSLAITETEGLSPSAPPDPQGIALRLGSPAGARLAPIGLAVTTEAAAAALGHAAMLKALAVDHLAARHDRAVATDAHLSDLARLAAALGLPVSLEILLLDEEDPAPEIAAVRRALDAAGLAPAAVAAFPKTDERSFQPSEPRPPSPALEDVQAALRAAFPEAAIGGGTPSFFTELNRKRPPTAGLDFIAHGTSPLVHAADDLSVMETLEALPSVVRSVRAMAGGRDYRISHVAIGARMNPYGAGVEPNPDNQRIALAEMDPRQRGLFAAAWHVGYAARLASENLSALVLGAPTGPFGLIHTRQATPQPWYDDQPGPAVFPLFHVVADLAEGGGRPAVPVAVSAPRAVAALAFEGPDGTVLMVANLTARPQRVTLPEGMAGARLRCLDETTFRAAALSATAFRQDGEAVRGRALVLRPYAVATLHAGPDRTA